MRLLRDPARLAMFGALTLLLAWTVDNLVRDALDGTVAAIANAKRSLDDQEHDAWLAGRLLDLQDSSAAVQRMIMTAESRNTPLFSPAVLQMLERQVIYERHYQDLANLAKRATAANDTLSAAPVSTANARELQQLAADFEELRRGGQALQEELYQHAQALKIAAFAGQSYSAADDEQMLEQLRLYESGMAKVLMTAGQSQQRLETTIRATLVELQQRRHWLETASTCVRWLYVLLFLGGTGLTIAAKRSEKKS